LGIADKLISRALSGKVVYSDKAVVRVVRVITPSHTTYEIRTPDGQIVDFVVSECNANWSHYLSKTLSILEYLGVRFNGDWSSSGPTFYVANRERWWPTPTINCINRRING